jgi:hypothetical protein
LAKGIWDWGVQIFLVFSAALRVCAVVCVKMKSVYVLPKHVHAVTGTQDFLLSEELYNKSSDDPLNKKIFRLGACFLIFSKKKSKNRRPNITSISPPEAAKYL